MKRKLQSSQLRAYVYISNGFDVSHTVQATSQEHAISKLEALHGVIVPAHHVAWVKPLAEHKAEVDASLEPMGLASWQRRLTRQTDDSAFGL